MLARISDRSTPLSSYCWSTLGKAHPEASGRRVARLLGWSTCVFYTSHTDAHREWMPWNPSSGSSFAAALLEGAALRSLRAGQPRLPADVWMAWFGAGHHSVGRGYHRGAGSEIIEPHGVAEAAALRHSRGSTSAPFARIHSAMG